MTTPLRLRTLRRTAGLAGAALLVLACGSDGSDSPARLPLAAGAGSTAAAMGEADAASTAAPMPAGDMLFRNVEYEAGPGLPELGGDRTVYRVDRGGDDALRAIADELGLDGDITTERGARLIRTDSGTLESFDGSFWNWFDGEAMDGVVAVACSPDGECEEPEPPQRPADLPTKAEAETIARNLLSTAGPSLDGAEVTVEDGVTSWFVDVEYQVDGMAAQGLRGHVVVGDGGRISSASGPLGDVVEVGSYPTISAIAAIDRLTMGWGPMPMATDVMMGAPEPAIAEGPPDEPTEPSEGVEPAPAPEEPETVEPAPDRDEAPDAAPVDEPTDEPIAEEFEEPEPVIITLLDAEWTLTSFWSWDDSGVYLLPAYRYTADDGSFPVVPAVTDDVIAPPPASDGDDGPEPAPRTDTVEGGGEGETSPGAPGGGDVDEVDSEPVEDPEVSEDPAG